MERVVPRDHGLGARVRPAYSHGMSTWIRVPRDERTVDVEAAVERRDAVGEAAQPRAALRVGTADPVVGDRDDGASLGSGDLDRHVRGLRVLRDVRERLGDDVVDRRLHRGGSRSAGVDSCTGTGLLAATASSAGPRPRSLRIAG